MHPRKLSIVFSIKINASQCEQIIVSAKVQFIVNNFGIYYINRLCAGMQFHIITILIALNWKNEAEKGNNRTWHLISTMPCVFFNFYVYQSTIHSYKKIWTLPIRSAAIQLCWPERKTNEMFREFHFAFINVQIRCSINIFTTQFPKNASSQVGHHVHDQICTFAVVNFIYDGVLFYWKLCCFSSVLLALWIYNWFRFSFSPSSVLRSIARSIFYATCEDVSWTCRNALQHHSKCFSRRTHGSTYKLKLKSNVWYLTNCTHIYAFSTHVVARMQYIGSANLVRTESCWKQKRQFFPHLTVTHISSSFCFCVPFCRDSRIAISIF